MKAFHFTDLSKADAIVNFRVNDAGFLEKRTGTALTLNLPDRIRGALTVATADSEVIYLVSGRNLYRVTFTDGTPSSESLGELTDAVYMSPDERVELFMFAGKLCILAGGEYFTYSSGSGISKVAGYVPLVLRSCNHSGVGTDYERLNLLTNKARATYIADGTSREYQINGQVVSVDAVYIRGRLLTRDTDYTVTIAATYALVNTKAVYAATSGDNELIEIHYTLSKANERSRVTSCTRAVAYGGDTDSRIFLWGGDEIAAVFPSEPSGAKDGQSISFDYFPVGTPITVGDGNLPVCGACRQFDRLALFTSESAYYTYPHDDGLVNTIRRFSYPVMPLNSDIGATKNGGAVLVENEPYSLSRNSLYRFKSTTIRDERLAIRVEPPAYMGFTTAQTEAMKLYVNKLRGELWCYGAGDGIAVYNARLGCWYRFEGFEADEIFSFGGEPAYFSGTKLYLSSDTVFADNGVKFTAYCETGWLDLGDAFDLKTIKDFGISVGGSKQPRAATVTLTADGGVYPVADSASGAHPLRVVVNDFSAPPSDSPTVFKVRGRLGRVSHLKVKIAAANDGKALILREFAVTIV